MKGFALYPWAVKHGEAGIEIIEPGDNNRVIAFVPIHNSGDHEFVARAIAKAPEMYYAQRNIAFELSRGNGSDPEYVKLVIDETEDMIAEIDGAYPGSVMREKAMKDLLKECASVLSSVELFGRIHPINLTESTKKLGERINAFLGDTEGSSIRQ